MYPIPEEVVSIKVCRVTGSTTTDPYEVIDISASDLKANKKHGEEVMQFVDIIL
jgi:hypothetical protein